MTTPRDRMPRPLPPSDAYVLVTPAGVTTILRRRRWRLQLIDGPAVTDLGVAVGDRDHVENEATRRLRGYLLPEEVAGEFTVRGSPTRGPSGPSGVSR